jgi:hypothetical protein
LNGLPEGTSPPQTHLGPADCAAALESGTVVKFAYVTGELVDVYVHTRGCTPLSATNGARTTEISDALGSALFTPFYFDGMVELDR